VIFLGDVRQHTAVEAGDFVRVLEKYAPVQRVELMDIRRQRVSDYRAAIKLMAVGAVADGLERLDAAGWVKEGKAGRPCGTSPQSDARFPTNVVNRRPELAIRCG